MLIAKIYVNERQIDTIHIQNTGDTPKPGFFTYRIRKPEGISVLLTHERSKGYHSLLIMALNEINYALNKKRKK